MKCNGCEDYWRPPCDEPGCTDPKPAHVNMHLEGTDGPVTCIGHACIQHTGSVSERYLRTHGYEV